MESVRTYAFENHLYSFIQMENLLFILPFFDILGAFLLSSQHKTYISLYKSLDYEILAHKLYFCLFTNKQEC